jgi:RNA polymerase sigma-70 factor (ECF subfamily)
MLENDRDLVERLQKPESRNAAFRELMSLYQEKLYSHIRRMVGNHTDADDVLQNTFVKVYRYIDKFKGDSKLYTWVYKIASNEALNHLNKENRMRSVTFEPQHVRAGFQQGPDGEEISHKLKQAVATLPEKQRQVFDLKYFEEMKYEEIAEITGTSIGGLKASYYHAVKKIEEFLTG